MARQRAVRSGALLLVLALACFSSAAHALRLRSRVAPKNELQFLLPTGNDHDDEHFSPRRPASIQPGTMTDEEETMKVTEPEEEDRKPTEQAPIEPATKTPAPDDSTYPPEDTPVDDDYRHCSPVDGSTDPHQNQSLTAASSAVSCKPVEIRQPIMGGACACSRECTARKDCMAWTWENGLGWNRCAFYSSVGPQGSCKPMGSYWNKPSTWQYSSNAVGCFDFPGFTDGSSSGSVLSGGKIIQRITNRKSAKQAPTTTIVKAAKLNCCLACRLSEGCVKYVKHAEDDGFQCDLYDWTPTAVLAADTAKTTAKYVIKNVPLLVA